MNDLHTIRHQLANILMLANVLEVSESLTKELNLLLLWVDLSLKNISSEMRIWPLVNQEFPISVIPYLESFVSNVTEETITLKLKKYSIDIISSLLSEYEITHKQTNDSIIIYRVL